MLSATTALVCALAALNRTAASMPPIQIIETAPSYTSVGTEAFVDRSTGVIYLIASSAVVQAAASPYRHQCGDPNAVKKLASILIHEEWHVLNGPDEKAAYERQLRTLLKLDVRPESPLYRSVQRSMFAVLERKRQTLDVALANHNSKLKTQDDLSYFFTAPTAFSSSPNGATPP